MKKSSELQSSTVCTSVSSYVGLESLLPAKEHQKLHGHADFLQWLPYFVSAAHCAGYWETYTDVAVKPVDPSNIAISPPEIQVRMDAQSFLDKWVSDEVRTILDQADDSTAFATKFLLLKSIYDPTGKITEAVVKLNDINLDDSLPVSLIINKFLVFQYELAVAGVEFSDNQLLKLLLPTLRGLSQAVLINTGCESETTATPTSELFFRRLLFMKHMVSPSNSQRSDRSVTCRRTRHQKLMRQQNSNLVWPLQIGS